ncbi:MAG: asparagine synthase (glutamine-hydrolyzing) [Thiomicrospira sp.]|nr:asparagine synthase (glutamine-hydrolyzing) [Thiomicrospira sp.]
MCSIYGSIGKNYKNIEQPFPKELFHRGPDDDGIYYDDRRNLSLGHTRLSIIDLSNQAHQPMSDSNENFVLVFNGEIYNYLELKIQLQKLGHFFKTNSDTEVVLKSYIEWGEECVNNFRGMFAFCIYDKSVEALFLARDRFGIKPLIYSFLDSQFVFCSELKPLLTSSILPKKLSYESVNDYFRYGSVKQPKTMLEGIYHLLPGHSMKVNLDCSYTIRKYYDLVAKSSRYPHIDTYQNAVKAVRLELEEATKFHMIADVEIGAFLSGGVDSTAVVALMKQCCHKQINTFSLGFKDKTNVEDETDIATRSAKYLGCNHHNIKIDDDYVANVFDGFIGAIDQPTIDGINTYIVSLETAKELKVALSGLGGDEIFAGYPHFKTISSNVLNSPSLVSSFGKALNRIRPNRFTNRFEFYGIGEEEAMDIQRTINPNLDTILKNTQTTNNSEIYKNLSSIQKISKVEIDQYMLNTLLRDNDVMSMAHSLEVRPILLDHKLVELAFSLQDNFKIRNGILKSVFIDSVKNIIPGEVYTRKKTGFEMPFVRWMNGCLNDVFKNALDSKYASHIFTKSYLTELHKRAYMKSLKRKDWTSLVFLCWIERFDIEV